MGCGEAVFCESRAFRRNTEAFRAARQLNLKISARDSYECSRAGCPAVAGTAGRPTIYATLALASINNAAR